MIHTLPTRDSLALICKDGHFISIICLRFPSKFSGCACRQLSSVFQNAFQAREENLKWVCICVCMCFASGFSPNLSVQAAGSEITRNCIWIKFFSPHYCYYTRAGPCGQVTSPGTREGHRDSALAFLSLLPPHGLLPATGE